MNLDAMIVNLGATTVLISQCYYSGVFTVSRCYYNVAITVDGVIELKNDKVDLIDGGSLKSKL